MPLLVKGKRIEETPSSVTHFLQQFPHFAESAEALKKAPLRTVGPVGLLYVGQREMAATLPSDSAVTVIGSSDATTCHIAVLRHSASGVMCVAHLDGSDTARNLKSMLDKVRHMAKDCEPGNGRLELHLVGGFKDKQGHSQKLSMDLIKAIMQTEEDVHLLTACITDHNTEMKQQLPFPSIYGIGVDVKTGEIFKADFTHKGPDHPIRSARHFTGGKNLIDIYDHKTQHLTIGPFGYSPLPQVELYLRLPEAMIRQHLSTSPEQEPPHFEASVRQALVQLRDHPEPSKTVFPDSQPRRYQLLSDGTWSRV